MERNFRRTVFFFIKGKAKERQYTVNAETALTATQAILSEKYATNDKTDVTKSAIVDLTSMKNTGWSAYYSVGASGKDLFKVTAFSYQENGEWINWDSTSGKWSKITTAKTAAKEIK